MSKALRIAGGVVAIWEDASDDDPFTAPLDNLPRVKFSSLLDYTKVIDVRTVSISLPGRVTSPAGNVTTYPVDHLLFAHGQPITPLVFATVKIGGVDVAFTGSIPQRATGSAAGQAWARWLTVGFDATNVTLYEYTTLGSNGVVAALNLDITVWVTDEDYS